MSQIVKKDKDENLAVAERTRCEEAFTPRFDIVETDEELLVFGDMPGVAADDVEIRFENEHLLVHGKTVARHEDKEAIYSEYGIGDFYREFKISEAVDAERITAEINNGVLTLHLPKAEAVKPKRIEVKSG